MDQLATRVAATRLDDFDGTTDSLTRDYLVMQDQLAAIASELMHARRERVGELLEKERVADRLAQLLAIMPAAVLVADADGIVIESNHTARDLLGRPLVGRTWAEIVARIAGPVAGGNGELRLSDGRCLALARRSLAHEGGELLLLTDISETTRLQALVEQQNRLSSMGEMSARLAHQVRTPLAAATLCLSQLEASAATLPAEARKYVSRSLRRLGDLRTLVDDMLMFARGEPAQMHPVDLAAIARSAMTTCAAAAATVSLRVDGEEAVMVHGARQALHGAVVNLLNNALAHSPAAGEVLLGIGRHGGDVRLSVRDFGPGVPLEFQDRIFEPFFSTRSQGTGLGLAVVQTVATAHGGRIEVADRTDGAEFTLTLPAAARGNDR
ncbi:MAG: ATP-binding protein [Pseudomonadota bacterium]